MYICIYVYRYICIFVSREEDYTDRCSTSLMLKMSVASRRGAHCNKK